MSEAEDSQTLIQQALAGDPGRVRALVDRLSPVIAKRVAATLWRRTGSRNVAQEANDMCQEVFLALFQSDGKALRAWDPARGMSLDSFVGLLAQHQVISLLRSGRTSPWREQATEDDDLEKMGTDIATPETVVASREDLGVLLDRLRDALSPRGLELFQRIVVDEEPVETLIATTGMTREALYQWKSRLVRTVRTLAAEGEGPTLSEKASSLRIAKGAPRR